MIVLQGLKFNNAKLFMHETSNDGAELLYVLLLKWRRDLILIAGF